MKIDLKKYRKENRLTQHELALKLGCSQATIAQVENDNQDVGVKKLSGWAEILGVEPHYLLSAASVDSGHTSTINSAEMV